ncbi:MAG: addiction module protein [Deltaproteobacteria bacterium CG_4_8_14_3_um_filter_51_11]|nr:addiction module protein [bacterium]OIP39308.1 MAG: addiction module protein [Desulfobacteraceae bacterium CG2_30_51_40]PIP44767.1 MAG: addiction module protein [Deltaproteobacteria bacterium CG23_combo_of_CG06-09_8_20_14_all_51_20]PIX20790.1 MAG: addiction module protein [Deltaproteobacteria bacterium CG_4_8_14_3_um_filter_51_11]PIY23488.1 MAG: addiction module protein [Deltaproteobacteria bacterium CG_4_10_14_3_um_filter_51_14]PJB38008.1 MAG: addiction module protein [Deltaproteobacteria 
MQLDDIAQIDSMNTSEKILLVEDIWDEISSDEFGVPVPQSHKEELDRRLRRCEAHPGDLLSLEELQGRIQSRK